jgi:hypothetical protein
MKLNKKQGASKMTKGNLIMEHLNDDLILLVEAPMAQLRAQEVYTQAAFKLLDEELELKRRGFLVTYIAPDAAALLTEQVIVKEDIEALLKPYTQAIH